MIHFIHLILGRLARSKPLTTAILLGDLIFPSLAVAQSSNLNMVAVGINRYRTPGMNLTYAVPDAQELSALLNANGLFARKEVNVLLNEQATLSNILNAIALLERRATANSYSVLFLSGHGSRDAGGHFIYPAHDFDPRNAAGTSISGEAVYARLKKMPGRVFLIIDACHSGSAGFTKTHMVKPDPTNQTVIISSSLATEFSLELHEYKNGAFTQGFLEALSGAGDANKDGKITLQEMHNYVYTRVNQITNNKQHMKTFVPTVALGNTILALVPRVVAGSNALWQGKETFPGYGALSSLSFAMESNGRVVMTDAKGKWDGTWSQAANGVTLRFANGRIVYSGRINGTMMTGTATNGTRTWTFSLARK